MTEKQRIYRNRLLAKIHANSQHKEIKKAGAWSDYLENLFGVDSSAKLSIRELLTLLEHLKGGRDFCSYEPDIKGRRYLTKEPLISKKQLVKLFSLKSELGYSDKALRDFVYKHTKKLCFSDSYYESLSKKEATKLISILSKIKTWKESKEN